MCARASVHAGEGGCAAEESGRGRPVAWRRRGGGAAGWLGRSTAGQPGGIYALLLLTRNGEGERGAAQLYNLGTFGPGSCPERGLKPI